ncbi:MAG TPA: phenylalanine--tRNA ligase subunit beta, partial [Blastocatellia bacterium]|nr:phenylalanine--tRNA ligase subunit beta [Blastocatellia bacterium]
IESAYFNPASIRRTARALGMDTEASYRFSRGADPDAQARAADRVAQLVSEIAGGRVAAGVIDAHPVEITREPVPLRESRIERLTGLRVSIERAVEILRGLGFSVEPLAERKELLAVAPSFRIDVSREEDLVEEVARHVGYELVGITLPDWSGSGSYLAGEERRRAVRRILTGLGFNEAITFSFVNGERDRVFNASGKPAATLINPIDVNEASMRTSMLTGLLESLQRNFNHGSRDVKLFEHGRVFEAGGASERPSERVMLGLVLTGSVSPDDWRGNRQADFYDMKGAVEAVLSGLNISGFTIERASVEYLHPGQSAFFVRGEQSYVRMGRLHPRVAALYKFRQPVYVAEIEFGKLLALPSDPVVYSALPRLPASSRDVSALVPDTVQWGDVENAIKELRIGEIVGVRVFDMYKGKDMPEGFHSLAFRVTYRGEGRTLTDEEISAMHDRVRETLQQSFGAQIR